MKHSPGKWIVGKCNESYIDKSTYRFQIFTGIRNIAEVKGDDFETRKGNAQLMASSKELFEACNAARRFVAADSVMTVSECLRILDIAIAGAEGGD